MGGKMTIDDFVKEHAEFLQQRVERDEQLHQLHKDVWIKKGWEGNYDGFNETAFHKFRRAVEETSDKFPGLYADYKLYVDMYESMVKYK